ncbi:MAG: 30S ribosomal protein S4, partial [Burkholderiales bacterium]|nr:30S ribosomal protein S4 [Burkholderiales bacterium]
ELDAVASRGKVLSLPSRGEIDTAVDEKIIVEFYSRMGG